MEQIVIRNLPVGTKAALRARASRNHRAMEAEARVIIGDALSEDVPSIVDLLAMPEDDIDFDPPPLQLTARAIDL